MHATVAHDEVVYHDLFEIEVRRLNRDSGPRVMSSRAVLQRCSYDAGRKILAIEASSRPEDRADMEYYALISGPQPQSIEGAALVDDRDLTYPEASVMDAVAAEGFVIRFKPGTITLAY